MMDSFCCLLSLQAGCTISSAIFVTLGAVVLVVNLPNFGAEERTYIVIAWIVLIVLTAIMTFASAYQESSTLAFIALVFSAITLIYWFVVALIPFIKEKDYSWIDKVCIESRCGESLWLLGQHWRVYNQKDHISGNTLDCCKLSLNINNQNRDDILPFLQLINNSQLISKPSILSQAHNFTERKRIVEKDKVMKRSSDELNSLHFTEINTTTESNPEQTVYTFLSQGKYLDPLIDYRMDNLVDFSSLNKSLLDSNTFLKIRKREDNPPQIQSSLLNKEPRKFVYSFDEKHVSRKGSRLWGILLFIINFCFFFYCFVVLLSFWISFPRNDESSLES